MAAFVRFHLPNENSYYNNVEPMAKKGTKLPIKRREASLVRLDPLTQYMRQAESFPLLSPEDERELFRQYQKDGDVEAARKLVSSHLRLVIKIAMEYRNAYYNLLDLIQEGNVGLMVAVKKYDLEKGARLASYATWWIRSYILKYILDNFRLIKIGTTKAQRRLFYNLIGEKRRIEAMGFRPDARALSDRFGVTIHEIEEMNKRLALPEYSLQAPVSHEPESATLQDFISDDDVPIDEKIAKHEMADIFEEKFKEFAQSLKPRELKIFEQRLLAEIPRTLQSIADEYGISKERARQIEARIIERLKKYFEDSGIAIEDIRGVVQ